MSAALDRLVDACLLLGFDGGAPPEWLRRSVDEGLGGVVVYGRNVVACEGELRRLTAPLRAQRADLLVAADEEGGDVTRLHYREGSTAPGNLALGTVDDVALTRRVAAATAAELVAAGITLDLAPCLDVAADPRNPVVGVRSFGGDAALVARHGRAVVEALQAGRVAACAKHFPGHGATHLDSHVDLPSLDAPERLLRERELVPFAAAVDAGVRAVLTAHVVYPAVDDLPATLSRRLVEGLLRGELGFDGVVATDALDMQAVAARWGIPRAAVLALAAGCDALVTGPFAGERLRAEIRAEVAAAVADGRLARRRLEEAAERVRRLGAWAAEGVPGTPDGGAGLEAARRALRVEAALPLAAAPFVVELRADASLAVGAAHWSLAEQLSELGFLAGSAGVAEGADLPSPAGGAPLVVACRDAHRSAWQRRAIELLRPDVLVAVGLPDDRALAPAGFVAALGAGRVNLRAAAEALRGR